MENLKEYIPLIIIAASFVIYIVKGARKKSQQDVANTNMPKGVGTEIVTEIPHKKKQGPVSRPNLQPVPSPELFKPKPKPTQQQPAAYDVWADTTQEQIPAQPHYNQPAVSSVKESFYYKEEVPVVTENNDSASFALDFENVDELKRGIIYSEILHRKYS